MSDSKKHNSILFLTTLSVYLGLVLVGGANSPVLAQAALTRNFDIQEELEYKDDLDKKPEDEKSDKSFEKKQSLELYFDVLSQFIKKAPLHDYQVSINVTCDFCRQKFGNEFSLNNKQFALENLEINLGNDWMISKSNLQPITFDADSKGLISQLNEKLFSVSLVSKNAFEKLILDNTSVITQNDQVLIVTNLPRASIDSLFAKTDANQAASESEKFNQIFENPKRSPTATNNIA